MLGLAGHSLTVNSLAWQEDQKGGNRIVTGAHDESVCLFEFTDAEVMEGLTTVSSMFRPLAGHD